MTSSKTDQKVYNEALQLAAEHYENFPVASFLFPKKIRIDVALIYRFARTADDIVDEGNLDDGKKLFELTSFRNEFAASLKGEYHHKFWKLLHRTIINHKLSAEYFFDLLDAFEQDLMIKRYKTFNELLQYCNKSANPVGRIILQLYGIDNEKVLQYSDDVCTALQLTNFWQDVKIDLQKNRIYIPLEDFQQFNYTENELITEQMNDSLRQIIEYQVERTEKMFMTGSRILELIPYRLQLQVGWTINGGKKILYKISKNKYDVLNYRPTLSKIDYVFAFLKTLL